MPSNPAAHRLVLASACAAIAVALFPGRAAGDYVVGNCMSDPVNYNTQAFEQSAHLGMLITRTCNPVGPGTRALITSNVVRGGRVERSSRAKLTLSAPPGTQFTYFTWGGAWRRQDCRYSVQIWADVPDVPTFGMIPVLNKFRNRDCDEHAGDSQSGGPTRTRLPAGAPAPGRLFGLPEPETHNISGATRIIQRVICAGKGERKWCSANSTNYIRTFIAEVGIADVSEPTVSIFGDTPLARGEWVRGDQPLTYDATDNVGVKMAYAIIAGKSGGFHGRPCNVAVPDGVASPGRYTGTVYAELVPCPNGRGAISVDTRRFLEEGTRELIVQAEDTAGKIGTSAAVTARVDNTSPGRVDVSVEGGQEWRNRNDFAVSWTNPPEVDRAPIAAAPYTLCPVRAGSCIRGEQTGADLSRFGVPVPAAGEWRLSLWRRDAAGNENDQVASVPVTLRYDPEPPQLAFEAPSASDPTLVAVQVTDKVSGLADGAIEISASGSGTWHTLATQRVDGRLLARIDDAALPPGGYVVRARASDQAHNEASTDLRLDGQPMALTLPLRTVSTMQAAFEQVRTVRRTIRRHGKRVRVRRPVTVLAPSALLASGEQAQVAGRLVNPDGQGIAGAEVRVYSSSPISPEELVAVLQTDGDGRFAYAASGSSNRTLRFAYAGSPLVLPAQSAIGMSVPALSSLRASRRRLLNGQAVTFTGQLRTQPVPAEGKLVELQVRLSGRWQTFRTMRTDTAGRWSTKYRFRRTRGLVRYRFRARLPPEAGYPFLAGGSRPVSVRVRGR